MQIKWFISQLNPFMAFFVTLICLIQTLNFFCNRSLLPREMAVTPMMQEQCTSTAVLHSYSGLLIYKAFGMSSHVL